MLTNTADRRAKVLSISGGGYLGLYSALALQYLEGAAPCSGARSGVLHSNFEAVAGTSVGGILALAVALGHPASSAVRFMKDLGADVFPKLSTLQRLSSLWKPLYRPQTLRGHLEEYFGVDTTLDAAQIPIAIPALNLTENRVIVFRGGPLGTHGDLRVVDVAMATSAAPFYFPAARVGTSLYADGGMVANAPDLLALQLAYELGFRDPKRLHLLSIGTTIAPSAFSAELDGAFGLIGWLRKNRRLLTHAMKGQSDLSDYLVRTILPDEGSVLRVDATQTEDQSKYIGIDVANETADAIINQLLQSTIDQVNSPLVRARNAWILQSFNSHQNA